MVVDYAHVFPGFLAPVQTQVSFQGHRLLFSHASTKVRGENTPEKSSPQPGIELTTTRSEVQHVHHCRLSYQGGAQLKDNTVFLNLNGE